MQCLFCLKTLHAFNTKTPQLATFHIIILMSRNNSRFVRLCTAAAALFMIQASNAAEYSLVLILERQRA